MNSATRYTLRRNTASVMNIGVLGIKPWSTAQERDNLSIRPSAQFLCSIPEVSNTSIDLLFDFWLVLVCKRFFQLEFPLGQ